MHTDDKSTFTSKDELGAGIVTQWANLLFGIPLSLILVPDSRPTLIPTYFPANVFWETAGNWVIA